MSDKITNTSAGPRIINVRVKNAPKGQPDFKQIVLQKGESVEGFELYSPDGVFEKGLIEAGDLVLGEVPTTPTTNGEAKARISDLEKELEGVKNELAEAKRSLASVTAERDALKQPAPGSTPSTNNRNR